MFMSFLHAIFWPWTWSLRIKPGTNVFVLWKESGIGQWEVPCLKLSSIKYPFLMICCNKDTCFIFPGASCPDVIKKKLKEVQESLVLKANTTFDLPPLCPSKNIDINVVIFQVETSSNGTSSMICFWSAMVTGWSPPSWWSPWTPMLTSVLVSGRLFPRRTL